MACEYFLPQESIQIQENTGICSRNMKHMYHLLLFLDNNNIVVPISLREHRLFYRVPAISHQHMYWVTLPTKVYASSYGILFLSSDFLIELYSQIKLIAPMSKENNKNRKAYDYGIYHHPTFSPTQVSSLLKKIVAVQQSILTRDNLIGPSTKHLRVVKSQCTLCRNIETA